MADMTDDRAQRLSDILAKSGSVDENGSPTPEAASQMLSEIAKVKRQVAEPVDPTPFQKMEQDAKDLYQKRADRTDWLELSDRLGRALARIGAAKAGMAHGVDTSNIDLGDKVDWSSRLDRAAKERQFDIEAARNQFQRAKEARAEQEEASQAQFASDVLAPEKGLAAALDIGRERGREFGATKRAETAESAQTTRMNLQTQADQARMERENLALANKTKLAAAHATVTNAGNIINSLDRDITRAETKLSAANSYATMLNDFLTHSPDSKNKAMVQKQMATLAGRAGLDPSTVQPFIDQATTSGFLGDKVDTKQLMNSLRSSLITPMTERVKAAEAHKSDFLSQHSAALKSIHGDASGAYVQPVVAPATQTSAPSTPAAAPASTVKVKSASGQLFNLPSSQLDEAIRQGYTQVK